MKTSRLFLCALAVATVAITGTHPVFWGDSRVITHVPTTVPVIALTIDDGPHYKTTREVLAVLKEKDIRATFFVLGQNVEKHPELLAREIEDGHEIAVHAYHHNSLAKLDKTLINEELEKTEQAIAAKSSVKPILFRPPGGAYSETVIAAAHARGYSIVLWDIDPHDWTRPSVDSVVEHVLKQATPGSIVLLHDGQYPLPTAKALAIIIDRLRAQGYQIITVGEMLQLHEQRPVQGIFRFF